MSSPTLNIIAGFEPFPLPWSVCMRPKRPFPNQCPITGSLKSEASKGFSLPTTDLHDFPTDSTIDSVVDSSSPVAEGLSQALTRELLLLMLRGQRQSENILAYLAVAEGREVDPWLRDDIRIAWLTVLHCAQGLSSPWEYAFWRYLGKHPDKLIPLFVERERKHRAMGVPDYDPLAEKRRA